MEIGNTYSAYDGFMVGKVCFAFLAAEDAFAV